MTLKEMVEVLRQRWRVVVVCVLVVVGLAVGTSSMAERSYESSASVYYSLPFGDSGADLLQGANYTQNQMLSFAELAETPYVLQDVIDELGLSATPAALSRRMSAEASDRTVLIELKVSDTSPARAAAIANSWAEALVSRTQELSPQVTEGSSIEATVVERARPAGHPSSPNTRRNVAAGLIAGLLLGVLAAIGRDRLDTFVRHPEDLADIERLPVLGQVQEIKNVHPALAMLAAPQTPQGEAFRRARVNLHFLGVDRRSLVLAVTSSTPGEGKTVTAINLAASVAEAGQEVLLIDADLRRPAVAGYLGLEPEVGLTTVLIGDATTDDVLQRAHHRFDVLASGPTPPNPSEMLSSLAMRDVLEWARKKYDVVLVDTPPVLPVSDAVLLASNVTGAIVVVRAGKVRRLQVATAVDNLRDGGAKVLGVLLNRAVVVQGQDSYYARETQSARAPGRHGGHRRDDSAREPQDVRPPVGDAEEPRADVSGASLSVQSRSA